MPILDMPLVELEKYQGINPCPEDFDDYWERALEEMKQVDSRVELIQAEFEAPFADCYHMYFTGVKGARIYAKLLKPKEIKKPAPALLMFHGYSDNSRSWSEKLQYVAAGLVVAAMDCRGQGGLSEDVGGVVGTTLNGHIIRGLDGHPDNLLMRDMFLDTAQLAKIVMEMEEVDEARVGVTGGSQGGGLTLACASLEPRIKKIAPIFPFLSDYQRVWEMDLAKDAYEELRYYFRKYDPLHTREKEIFNKLGYIDIKNMTSRIRGNVLMAITLMDNICPPSTQFAAYNRITSEKEAVIYPDYGHEDLPGFGDKTYEFMMKI